jgi:protein SERAC1
MDLVLVRVSEMVRTQAVADVVFIHGLGGRSPETWQVKDSSTFWPAWLLADLAQIEVWTLSYPAETYNLLGTGPDMELPDLARAVLDYMVSRGLGARPLIFITHSMGGLLAKQVLRFACEFNKPAWKELAANTRGIMFLGTPHTGSGIAYYAAALTFLGLTKTAAQLKDNDPHLRELDDWYRQNARVRGYATAAYYEMAKVKGVLVVDQGSANPGIEGCIPIAFAGHHLDICKPQTKSAPIYLGAIKFIQELASAPTDPVAIPISPSIADQLPTDGTSGLFDDVPATDDADDDAEQDEISLAIRAEVEFFTTRVDEDHRLDLEEKLRRGGMVHQIARATRLKEQFAKDLLRHQLQPSAVRRYIEVLSDIETRFNNDVFPKIAAGLTGGGVAELIREKVAEPILASRPPTDDLINSNVIDRMIFYLAGNCHIRWHYDVDEAA